MEAEPAAIYARPAEVEELVEVAGEMEIPYHKDFHKNQERSGNGEYPPCIVCGRGIKAANPAYVHVHCGGSHVVTEAHAATLSPGADLGFYPIGPCCLKKHPELRPYTHRPGQDNAPSVVHARPAELAEIVYAPPIEPYTCRVCGQPTGNPHGWCGCDYILGEESPPSLDVPPPAPICDNCAAPSTTTIELLQLCDACHQAATVRLLAAVYGHVCLSCGDPVDDPVERSGQICEACQEAGEPWPVAQAIQDGRAASGLVPVLDLHAWAPTDRPAFRAALAGLTPHQLEWQANVYSAYLTVQTGKTG